MSKLKPCPFCGGEIQITTSKCITADGPKTGYHGYCAECGMHTQTRFSETEAIADINRRVGTENKPLTLEQLQRINANMDNRRWVWIDVLTPFISKLTISAYYQAQQDYTHGRGFCCGYPGISFSFDYADYGKTWLAYEREQASK